MFAQAKWICDPRFSALSPLDPIAMQNEEKNVWQRAGKLANTHMLVRKTFLYQGGRALLKFTADDYCKLWLNGRYLCEGPAPAYVFALNVNTLDVTEYLQKGENVIAAQVYYEGLINRTWFSGDLRMGLMAELSVDGKIAIATGTDWKHHISRCYTSKKFFGYATQFIEDYDSRLEPHGWQQPDFDDTDWLPSAVIKTDYTFRPSSMEPIVAFDLAPAETRRKQGKLFYDFGTEVVGHVKITATGKRGDKVRILCGEELDEQGEVRYNTLCNCIYDDCWTLDEGENSLRQFEYKGFRYVELQFPAHVTVNHFCVAARHYPFDESLCTLQSSDTLLNSIFAICKNGVKWGNQEGFLDCPTREKGEYSGDMTITGQSHLYLTADVVPFQKVIEDISMSGFINQGLVCIANCALKSGLAEYSLQFALHLLIYYRHTGDKTFVERMLPFAEQVVSYFSEQQRADGMLENFTNGSVLVDWPTSMRDDYDFDVHPNPGKGCMSFINALFIGALDWMNQLYEIMGIAGRHDTAAMKKTFVKLFYRPESGLFVDSEVSTHISLHANIFPAYFGFHPEEGRKQLGDFFRMKGLCCGVYMSFFLLKACGAIGRQDLVWEIMMNRSDRSWYNMVAKGATTCWEVWDHQYKNNISLCHAWASAPISLLVEELLGISAAEPGWTAVHFDPHIPPDLEWLEFEMPIKTGKLKVSHHSGLTTLTLPEGVKRI